MYRIAIDPSLSKFAIVVFDSKTNKVVNNLLVRSRYSKAKKKYNWIEYFDTPQGKVNYVAETSFNFIEPYLSECDQIVIEGLSFASIGNATRDLAGVFHSFLHRLYIADFNKYTIYAPMTLTKHAKLHLKGELPTDKKKIAINLSMELYPDFINQFVSSATSVRAGKEDYADAICANITYCEKELGGFKLDT